MLHQRNKKGVSIIFTWIFVLIAGAIILSALIMIAFQGKESSEKEINIKYIDLLKNIIINFASSIEGSKIVSLPDDISANLGCSDVVMFDGGEGFSRDINRVFFAPSEIKSKELILWNLPWGLPFRVGDIVYLSSPNVKYYFVYSDQSKIDDFVDGFSDKFNFEKVHIQKLNLGKIKQESYINRFVFLDEPLPDVLSRIDGLGWSSVVMGEDYVEYNGEKFEVIGKELKYGAVFSDSFENYKCSIGRAMKEVEVISLLYAEKAKLLTIKNPKCFYSTIRSSLVQYSQFSEKLNMKALSSGADVLIEQNKQLDRQGCAVLF